MCAVLALVAFAANSILCRLALGQSDIDAASFSTIRLGSGAAALLLASLWLRHRLFPVEGTWMSAMILSLYAIPFSFAYLSLSAGTGALILFGSVQATMLLVAVGLGERPHAMQWIGLTLALAGLVYLVLPGLAAPSPAGSALMTIAGVSWGIYSVRGRGTNGPLLETTGNFVRSVPLALAVSLISLRQGHVTPAGALLAVASGALASGAGYVFWYAALTGLSATRAAMVQLPVPVLAAAGGVIFLTETITLRLVGATILILGGVGLALAGRERVDGRPPIG